MEDVMNQDPMQERNAYKIPVWLRQNVDAHKILDFLRERIEETTYDQVAAKIGVHVSSIFMIMNGKRVPRMKLLKKVVMAYGLNLKDYQLVPYETAVMVLAAIALKRGRIPLNLNHLILDESTRLSYLTLFSIHSYHQVMETVRKLCEGLVDVDSRHLERRSDEELLQLIRQKAIELGRTPKATEVPQSQTICYRFKDRLQKTGKNVGGWNRALMLAGLTPIRTPVLRTRHKKRRTEAK